MFKIILKYDIITRRDGSMKKIFLFVFLGALLFLLVNIAFNQEEINQYENRMAYKVPSFTVDGFLNHSYQDNIELAFSDQMPLSTTAKKTYNIANNLIIKKISEVLFKNKCTDRYISISRDIKTYGCDDNLVYPISPVVNATDRYDIRIKNINDLLSSNLSDVYIYYIEKDTDINFETNESAGVYEYLKNNINTDKMYKFQINNFNDFSNYFYKTDHHWNYKCSYAAYKQLVGILTSDKPIKYKNEKCIGGNFSGSKGVTVGSYFTYKEDFCVYEFDYPKYKIYVNGKDSKYGSEEVYLNSYNETLPYDTYDRYYGWNSGEVIFVNNNKSGNILILGESFDNPLLKLLASHFNKTYSIDLRYYEKDNGKKFDYSEYIEKNNIDKVLLIGNRDYFRGYTFNVEV